MKHSATAFLTDKSAERVKIIDFLPPLPLVIKQFINALRIATFGTGDTAAIAHAATRAGKVSVLQPLALIIQLR
ncbi:MULTISPECIES: hypothetical protein [unclassified Rhizobium]|uniref:hypothetical protein n=1 Tax=Rhizobium sp. N4311 TaxID=1703972 RepID=UPI0007EA93C2|nr:MULTISPECIES: hypothetical protein [unclassified Rhizobium]